MASSYRMERIERLLQELRYEVERGMMEGEVNETIGFDFIVPTSKEIPSGAVWCRFITRPMHISNIPFGTARERPKLRIVK